MRFYLNSINANNRVNVEVAPQITETFDESLDSAMVILEANNIKNPFAPNQYFYICDDNNNILYIMVLALDSVEIYSTKPLRYKHTLTLVQNTRNLNKSLVRNSVFTQPMNSVKKGYTALLNWLIVYDLSNFMWDSDSDAWIEPIVLTDNDVVYGDFTLKARIIGVKQSGGNPTLFYGSFSDILAAPSSSIRIKLYNGSTDTGVYYDLTNANLDKEIVVAAFMTYIKAHPSGNYCLRVDNPFVTNLTTPTTSSPSQFTLQLDYKVNVYYYNCYDLLNLLILRQQQRNAGYEKNALFSLPSDGDLYDLLVSTIPPNFTFTGNTMYECIADIFRLFDAIFILDENNVLGIEYFNEYGSEDNSLPTSYRTTHAEETFNRGLVNFYQDARVIERFPSSKGYAPARSSGLGVPTSTNDFCILLPHNIEYIDKVEMLNPRVDCSFYYFNGTTRTGVSDKTLSYEDDVIIDLNAFIFESALYGLLLSNDLSTRTNNQEKFQANCIYYEKGTNKIELGLTYQKGVIQKLAYNFDTILVYSLYRFLGKLDKSDTANLYNLDVSYYETNFIDIKTAVTYMATVDGSLKIESINDKFNGEMVIDQSNGAVDLNKLGANMFGLALKLGEPTLTRTLKIVDFANRIRKGQYILFNGEKWIANTISHTIFDGGKVQSVVNFVKNYNAISLYTRLNQQKRMSTISSGLVNKSEVLFGEYLYFTTSSEEISTNTKMYVGAFASLFSKTFSNDETINQVDYAVIDALKDDYTPYQFNDNGTTKDTTNIAIPLITYGSGNSLCFEGSFNHPKSAGNKTASDYEWYEGRSYYTNYIPYTNENGFMDVCSFRVYHKAAESNMDNFPLVNTTGDNLIIDVDDLVVKKYSNEIFAINYQVHLLPKVKDKEFVGREFINKNALVSVDENKKSFYIYYSTSEEYDILDLKGLGDRKPLTSVVKSVASDYFYLTFNFEAISGDIKSWAICDEEGDIYFAFNRPLLSTTSTRIYFYPRNQRIGVDELTYRYSVQVYPNEEGIASVDLQLARSGSTYYDETITTYLHKECNQGDTYTWSATPQFGYYVTSPSSGTGTVNGVVKIRPHADKVIYNIAGTSTNGTVRFYLTSAHISEITQAPYKTKVYWTITPDQGYNAPSTAQGNVIVDENNFTIVSTNATKTFDACTPIEYPVTFTLTSGISRVYFRVDGGIWRYRDATDTINIPYTSEVEWYAVPKTGCRVASDTPTENAHAFFNVPLNGTTKTANYTLITYSLIGTSSNGSVHFYLTSGHIEEIYSAPYGTTLYYQIEPNTGYNAPSPSSGSISLNSSNFTLNDTNETATKSFPACTIQQYRVIISKDSGVASFSIRINGGSWTMITGTYDAYHPYGTIIEYYAIAKGGYSISGGTSTSSSNPSEITVNRSYSISITSSFNGINVSANGLGTKNVSAYVYNTLGSSIIVTRVQVYYGLLDKALYQGSDTISSGGSRTYSGTTTINVTSSDCIVVTYTYNGNTYSQTAYF